MKASNQRGRSLFIAAIAAMTIVPMAAASDVQYACITNRAGNWSVTATAPFSASCPNLPLRECTEMQYVITPRLGRAADHVAVLVDHQMKVIPPLASYLALPCKGDSVTELGVHDCSTQAVRMNKDATTQSYNLFVEGVAAATGKSIVVKKGTVIEECRIASLAPSTCDPKAQQAAKETFQFEDCTIEIELDPCTGQPGAPTVTSGVCGIDSAPISTLQIILNGGVTQNVTIGDGWISSGTNSCTTRMFNGTSYTTCTCKDVADCNVKKSNGTMLCAGIGVCPP